MMSVGHFKTYWRPHPCSSRGCLGSKPTRHVRLGRARVNAKFWTGSAKLIPCASRTHDGSPACRLQQSCETVIPLSLYFSVFSSPRAHPCNNGRTDAAFGLVSPDSKLIFNLEVRTRDSFWLPRLPIVSHTRASLFLSPTTCSMGRRQITFQAPFVNILSEFQRKTRGLTRI